MGAAYAAPLETFLAADPSSILGQLTSGSARAGWDSRRTQIAAWEQTLGLLRCASDGIRALPGAADWGIVLEYDIPLRQKRPDVVLIARDIVFVIEAKIGESTHTLADQRQVETYCLDLRDFHAQSAGRILVPVLVACSCTRRSALPAPRDDAVQTVVKACASDLALLLREAYQRHSDPSAAPIPLDDWVRAAYRPVPGILQAAQALYGGHTVREIARAHAGNLTETADCLMEAIRRARDKQRKAICFVTGIPGSGKTLAGLNLVHSPELSTRAEGIATFLSGNGPLVRVMREALARDSRHRDGIPLAEARRRVATFIQNVTERP